MSRAKDLTILDRSLSLFGTMLRIGFLASLEMKSKRDFYECIYLKPRSVLQLLCDLTDRFHKTASDQLEVIGVGSDFPPHVTVIFYFP